MDSIVTTGFRCLILFSRLQELRLKIIVTNTLEYILEYLVRLQIYGRNLYLESSFITFSSKSKKVSGNHVI